MDVDKIIKNAITELRNWDIAGSQADGVQDIMHRVVEEITTPPQEELPKDLQEKFESHNMWIQRWTSTTEGCLAWHWEARFSDGTYATYADSIGELKAFLRGYEKAKWKFG